MGRLARISFLVFVVSCVLFLTALSQTASTTTQLVTFEVNRVHRPALAGPTSISVPMQSESSRSLEKALPSLVMQRDAGNLQKLTVHLDQPLPESVTLDIHMQTSDLRSFHEAEIRSLARGLCIESRFDVSSDVLLQMNYLAASRLPLSSSLSRTVIFTLTD